MKFSRISAVSYGFVIAAIAATIHSTPVHAVRFQLPVDVSASADVKARMQADLASTSGAQVDLRGDGRVYKGNGQENDDDVRSDKNVTKVESDDDSVSVSYKIPGKFLGFIPMGMVVRTTVGAAGDVKVSHPWYSFLVTSDDDGAEDAIKTEINAVINAYGVSGDVKLASSTKSAFIKAIHDVLKSGFSAEASVDTSASAASN